MRLWLWSLAGCVIRVGVVYIVAVALYVLYSLLTGAPSPEGF